LKGNTVIMPYPELSIPHTSEEDIQAVQTYRRQA
jgi:hypothetical protein